MLIYSHGHRLLERLPPLLRVNNGRAIRRQDIFDLAQIELMKGTQSLFYGKSTYVGPIAIRSAEPKDYWDSKMHVGHEFDSDAIDVSGYISGTDQYGDLPGYDPQRV